MNGIRRLAGSVFVALGTLATSLAHAGTCDVESGATRLPVLELYTSEGCNSCPPADRWLSREFGRPGTTPSAIPLAYHVDYWNKLGWPDRFSSPDYSARQQRVAARNRSNTIYTPQFVFDGRDVRPHEFADEIAARARGAAADKPRAHIVVRAIPGERRETRVSGEVRIDRDELRSRARVYVVLYQNGLSTQVKAGENGGKRLAHDFVVRRVAGPFTPDAAGRVALDVRLPAPSEFEPANSGVLVHAEDAVDGSTLQAVTTTICRAD